MKKLFQRLRDRPWCAVHEVCPKHFLSIEGEGCHYCGEERRRAHDDRVLKIKGRALLWLVFFAALGAQPAQSQSLSTVSAANITDGAGNKLAAGKVMWQPTDSKGTHIPIQIGGGGVIIDYQVCMLVVAGAITTQCPPNAAQPAQVANPAQTIPPGIYYQVTISDGVNVVRAIPNVTWSGATFNLDTFVPANGVAVPPGSSIDTLYVRDFHIVQFCTLPNGAACGSGGAGSVAQVNGVNLLAQSPFNLQNGTGTTASNPSLGNIQIAVNYGSSAGTAAQGNDSRITGAAQASGTLAANSPAAGNATNSVKTLPNWTYSDQSTAARTFNLPDANGSLIQLIPLTAHQWVNQINAQGAGGTARPDCGDLTALDGIVCTVTSPVAGQVLGFSDSTHIVNAFVTSPPDAPITTTTYTFATGDRNHLKVFNPAGSCALTLPQAGSAGFTGKWAVVVQNISAVDCVITPTTSTIGESAAATATVKPGAWVIVRSDDTNYPGLAYSPGQLLAGTGMTLTASATGVTVALTTPVSVANGGTGAATAGANTIFGNNTGSTAAPGLQSMVAAQEPSTTVNSVVNDTNVTGSIAAQALTLGWSGTVSVARGGTGTGSTLTGVVRGGSPLTASELSGDATTSGSNAVTVAKVNGVSYTAGPATNTLPLITAANTATYTALSDCQDASGNHLNFNASTHTFSCGTTSSTAASTLAVNTVNATAPNLANNAIAFGSNIYATNTPQFSYFAGDSVTIGTTGVTGTNQDYADLIQASLGGGETNVALSGAQAADMARLQVIPNTPVVVKPAAPVLATSTSGGSLAAATSDCVVFWFITSLGITDKSPETCITTGAGGANSITPTPPVPSSGQAGWILGYGVASGPTGAELTQAASPDCRNIPIGGSCVIQVLGAGAAPPSTNTGYIPNGTQGFLYISDIGINDVTQYGATASLQTVFKQAHLASLAWQTASGMVFAQNSACTPTGTWSVDNTGLSGLGEQSTTLNDSLACNITIAPDGALFVWYRIINSDGGTCTVKDGTTLLTDTVTNSTTLNFFPGAALTTLNGTTDTFALAIYTGLTQGAHTINFKVTSATNASNVVSISALGTGPSLPYATPARAFVGGVIRQQNDANSALTASYDGFVSSDVATLANLGLNDYFANLRNYVNSTTDMFNSLHPNNTGQAHIRDAFMALIQSPMNGYNYQQCFGQLTPFLLPDTCIYWKNAKELALGSTTRGDRSGTWGAGAFTVWSGANEVGYFNTAAFVQASNLKPCFSNSTTSITTIDLCGGRLAPGVPQISNTNGSTATGFLPESASLVSQSTSDYTNATTTPSAFATYTLPAVALKWWLNCNIAYQASASTATLALSVNASQTPTNMAFTGDIYINLGSTGETTAMISSASSGTVAVLTGGTPNATATNYIARLYGEVEASATAGTFAVQVAAGGTGTITIKRDSSSCSLIPTL